MADNSETTTKPKKKRGPGKPFAKGQSGNPGGRPKNEVSVTYWLREWGGMSSEKAAELCAAYADELRAVPGELPLAALVALRVWMSLASEPSPGLFSQVVDRIDGPVPTKLEGGESAIFIKIDR